MDAVPDRQALLALTRREDAHGRLLRSVALGTDLEDVQQSVTSLAEIPRRSDAAVGDLAAGRLLLALAGDLSQAARALDELTSARAMAGEPPRPRRCFNRALALEFLGLLGPARDDWQRCLPGLEEGWRREAEERQAALDRALRECRGRQTGLRSSGTCLDRESALKAGIRLLFAAPASGDEASEADVTASLESEAADHTWPEILVESRKAAASTTASAGGRLLARGLDAYERGEYVRAADLLHQAGERLDGLPGLRSIARLHELGAVLFARPAEARRELRSLVTEALRNGRGWVATYGSRLLTLLSARKRSPLHTLPAAEEALALAARFHYRAQAVELGLMLAETYSSLERADRSWSAATAALREAYRLGSDDALFFALNLATGIAEEQGLDRLAHLLQSEALSVGAAQPARVRASALLWRAMLRTRIEDEAGALRDLGQAAELIHHVSDSDQRQELAAELELASATLELGSRPEAAAARLSAVLETFRSLSIDNYLRALQMRADARLALGRSNAAAEDLFTAIQAATKRLQAAPDADWTLDDQVAFQGRLARWSRTLLSLEIDAGRPWAAFAVSESWKELAGRAGVTSLASVRENSPRLAEEISRRLGPRETVAAFARDGPDVVAWVIRPAPETSSWLRLGSRRELDRLLDRGAKARDPESARASLGALHRWLIGPLDLAGAEELTIIPDPGLEGLPFPSLVSPQGRYLVEDFLLRFAMSAAHLLERSPPEVERLAGNGVVVHAADPAAARQLGLPPLPAAGDEIAAVREAASKAGGDVRYLEGPNATPAAVLDALPGARWAHLIGHTTPGPAPIVPPALLLERDGQGRDWITAADVARLDLSAMRLAVLATCSSAVRGDDGWMSRSLLARGFLEAGAQGVIATLAPVDDRESAELFRLIYQQLAAGAPAAGAPVAEALRRAQVELLHASNGEARSWLSFVYLGQGRARPETGEES